MLISNAYNEGYYIGGKFYHQVTIKDIFYEKDAGDSHVYVAKTEGEYIQLCQLHPQSSVHWLEKENQGNSFGSNCKEA